MVRFWPPWGSKRAAPQPLAADVHAEIARFVRAGFYDKERLLEIFCVEMYAPGELAEESVAAAIEIAQLAHARDQQTWPDTTDCDRLERAFVALRTRGILVLENAGNTQSDGKEDVRRAHAEHPDPRTIVGYCFYHSQDLEAALDGVGLRLAFGPLDPEREESHGPEIGGTICAELRNAGLEPTWPGSFKERIWLPKLHWQRRTQAPPSMLPKNLTLGPDS
jgi:hypothetical protein